jgi:stress responsive alpha/beta barrel protein
MVSHLVLMQPRADLTAAQREEFIAAFERAIREIPTVRRARVGRRIVHGAGYEATAPRDADYIAEIDFDDLAGLQAYLCHPAHEELGVRFGRSLSAAMVYDFEVGGIEELRAGRFFEA